MNKITAKVISVHVGELGKLSKQSCPSIEAVIGGFVGDRHLSQSRKCWAGGDKQKEGTLRRNEREWSAMSVEEIEEIQHTMDLKEPISADSLGTNICLSGIEHLSRLPKGTILQFPSGAELIVEEYNPPCLGMGQKLAELHTTNSGEPIRETAFSKAAQYTRGIVGVVEVAGTINAGDDVVIKPYASPKWPS